MATTWDQLLNDNDELSGFSDRGLGFLEVDDESVFLPSDWAPEFDLNICLDTLTNPVQAELVEDGELGLLTLDEGSLYAFQFPELPLEPPVPDDSSLRARGSIELDFFLPSGAYRPSQPCSYCQRLRLNCFVLQSTAVNPNPLQSCSSCNALYRQCSFAERPKRKPHTFETHRPVIGALHGVNEEEDELPMMQDESLKVAIQTQGPYFGTGRKLTTRSVRKTRALRNWMNCHMDQPYPSEAEKTALSHESGLTMTQVNNWFGNARRREKHLSRARPSSGRGRTYPKGSPMPRSGFTNMTPLDRWKHSPPDQEPASRDAIESALRRHSGSSVSSSLSIGERSSTGHDSSVSGASESSFNSLSRGPSSHTASSYLSHASTLSGQFSPSSETSFGKTRRSIRVSFGGKAARITFFCTFCQQTFKKKYDWLRHERSVHMPSLSYYVCSQPLLPSQSRLIWRMHSLEPECIYCNASCPSEEHFLSHEWESCAEKPAEERTFTRKDHLWQHMSKFHGCKRWEGWERPELEACRRETGKRVRSRCGFCGESLKGWEERGGHLAEHFKAGLGMEDWSGGCGIEEMG